MPGRSEARTLQLRGAATRLAPNRFASEGMLDTSSAVVRLENLSAEDCFVLLVNIRNIHAAYDPEKYIVDDNGIEAYLRHCFERMGATYFQTPRDTVRDFVGLLHVLEQNPAYQWQDLIEQIGSENSQAESESEAGGSIDGDELAEFKL